MFFAPPSGVVFVYVLAVLTVIIGQSMAWAWGTITMKAALAARPAAVTQAKLMALEQRAVALANQTGESPTALAQVLVFEGAMLDARVTAGTVDESFAWRNAHII
jgi:hypothetical protein